MNKLVAILSLLMVCFVPSLSSAQEDGTPIFNKAKRQWTVLLGYGESHPGWGDTETRVRDYDFILKYGHFLSEEKGSSWYRGRHSVLIEFPFYYVESPKTGIMVGINILACWNFTDISEKVIPYVFAGGGPLYTNLKLRGLGTEFNGNYQAGGGFHYFLTRDAAVDVNYRYHHISNAGMARPNEPLNSTKIFMGLSRFW